MVTSPKDNPKDKLVDKPVIAGESKLRTQEDPADVSGQPGVLIDPDNDPQHPVARSVTTADVSALHGTDASGNSTSYSVAHPEADASAPVDVRYEADEFKDETPFLSEGMRHDILTYGYANEPATGRRVVRADAPKGQAKK